jgi:hypothetical protein
MSEGAGKSKAKVLKTSGDAAFDDAAQKTLGKWRLSRGPLVLELPLRFVLTPSSYRVAWPDKTRSGAAERDVLLHLRG